MSDATNPVEPPSWQCVYLRLIVFPTGKVDPNRWWEQVVGKAPEETATKGGTSRFAGPFNEHILLLENTPGKVTWSWTPLFTFDPPPENPPLLGLLTPKMLETFVTTLKPWLLKHCPPVRRIGFSSQTLLPSESVPESLATLERFLSFKIPPEGRDFQYRINRPRESKVIGNSLVLNRLATWSSVNFEFTMKAGLIDVPVIEQGFPAACLDIDVNTSHKRIEEIPNAQLPALFEELVEVGTELMHRGDIP